MSQYFAVPNPPFLPQMLNILTVTQGNPTIITTTFDGINPGANNYQTGLIVRLLIPYGWGFSQANGLQGTITVITPTQFSITIDSTLFDPFVVPNAEPGGFNTPPQVVPFGEINSILTQAVQNVLPYP